MSPPEKTAGQEEQEFESESATLSRREVLAGTAGLGLITKYDPADAPNNVTQSEAGEPITIGSRLELFVDDYLIDEMQGVRQQLHRPEPEEVVISLDEPWEGGLSGYFKVFRDEEAGLYRMYYRGYQNPMFDSNAQVTCYAESEDGIEWEKPSLGQYEFSGFADTNVVLADEPGVHAFAPFKDSNPDRDPDAKYKAVGPHDSALYAYKSPDGINWSRISDDPILDSEGAFDSQNVAFWDGANGEYRAYYRDFRSGRRIIETVRSDDFLNWTDQTALEYPEAPKEQLYTNGVSPYYRAPHILLGFPMRYVERDWNSNSMRKLPGWDLRQARANYFSQRQGSAVADTLFMSSRDRTTFRRWPRSFHPPGLWSEESTSGWGYGNAVTAHGPVETESRVSDKPRELSLYVAEDKWTDHSRLRRHTLRVDGFVSMQASLSGGEFVTHPVIFDGNQLVLNYATSAAGSIRVELQTPGGEPYPGFSLADSPEIFGDDLERAVEWPLGTHAGQLAGRPVRLRFVMKDADLYSFRFRTGEIESPEPVGEATAHWPLDEITGDSTVPDTSGNGNDGTNNGATVVDGLIDNAFAFDGNDHVDADLSLSDSMTVAGWFNPDSPPSRNQNVIDGGDHSWVLFLYPDLRPAFWVRTDDQGGHHITRGPSLSTSEWAHVAGVYDGSEISLYINGQLVSSSPASDPPPLDPSGPCRIGDHIDGGYDYVGEVDDVYVFNKALSEAQIQTLVGKA